MEKEILATVNATLSDVSLITLDRINALTGGHGSLNIAGIAAANAIISEIIAGEYPATCENFNSLFRKIFWAVRQVKYIGD